MGNAFEEQLPTSTGGYVLNLRSAGEYYDAESGLNNNGYRTRESASWRFLQSDPKGLAAGMSTYAAVGNNPLGYIDPSGLSWRDAIVLTYEWASGTGPQHQDFGPNTSEAAEMQNAPGVLAAEALYRKKNAQKIKNHCDTDTFEPVTNYAAHFVPYCSLRIGLESD